MGLDPIPPKQPGQSNQSFLEMLWGWWQNFNDNVRPGLSDRLRYLAGLQNDI